MKNAFGQARLAARVQHTFGVAEDPNLKVGINGFGRRGRLLCRAIRETDGIDLVAVNDPYIDAAYMAHMVQHDAVHGSYIDSVAEDAGQLVLDGRPISVTSHADPAAINWSAAGARYVVDCSGQFETARKISGHQRGGAQRVVVAGPCAGAPCFMMGVNHTRYANEAVVAAGSAAAQCLALLLKAVDAAVDLEFATASVVYASRSRELEQIAAGPAGEASADWRSGRPGGLDTIPAHSDAAEVVCEVLPSLAGRVRSSAFRVPAEESASAIDTTILLRSPAELRAVRAAIRDVRARTQHR